MNAIDALDPVLTHHIVNSLGWRGLRELQEEAIEPLLAGEDAILLAPTAGGKTEAASFPLLSRMTAERWRGTSVLYVCPLKALLNNLLPRLETYTGWLGRRAALWHGDVTAGQRRRILADRPDVLLTTPESLEAMLVEELGEKLRLRGVTTFLSHASLSVDERQRAEEAFAEARDCVIVSTSTLELGIDVGDLDRVIQIDAPATVASFLQRLGRTGRRAGTTRNCLFLALTEDGLTSAAGLLLLWSRGWVEAVTPPPEPRHIVAQQLIALCLQEHQVGDQLWREWWNGLGPFGEPAEPIVRHLVDEGYLDRDGGMLFVGPEAERRFGSRHFMGLTAVFTAPPQFTVFQGRREIGRTDPALLTEEIEGPRKLLLAGRSWLVTYIDWHRKRCFVEPADSGGKAKWSGLGFSRATSFELTRAVREVLLGTDPDVDLTKRAVRSLADARDHFLESVHPGGTLLVRGSRAYPRWWTWAGHQVNATLAASLGSVALPAQRINDCWIRIREDISPQLWKQAIADASENLSLPEIDAQALKGLKFAEALPPRLAEATLALRFSDVNGALAVLTEPMRFVSGPGA
ncbi:DEAD/DEAH box helicase [Streptomyces sp. NPDC005146]